MNEGLMLGWFVSWPGICVYTVYTCLDMCVFAFTVVCLSSYLTLCEPF